MGDGLKIRVGLLARFNPSFLWEALWKLSVFMRREKRFPGNPLCDVSQ
jgi:hypothetical protein